MGPDTDAMAVVDQYGRVRGIDSLRVVDASIMQECVRANIREGQYQCNSYDYGRTRFGFH